MATFEKNFSVHRYSKLVLVMTPGTPNIAGNYTPVSYRLYIQAFSGGRPYSSGGSYPYNVKIDGVTVASGNLSSYNVPTNGQFTIAQGTRNVYHNDNGTKTISVSGYFQAASVHGNATASGSITLSTIPRYAKITSFTIDAVTAIQFRFNYKVDRSIDTVQYSLNGGSWQSQPSGNIITGRSPNTSYTIKIRVRATASGLWTESNTLTVRTVALSTVATPSFNLGSNLGVTISRANSNMVHDVYLEAWYDSKANGVAHNSITNIATSVTLIPTEGAIVLLENKHPNTSNVQVRLRVVCRWGAGGAIQGTVYSPWGTAKIVNANPSIDGVSYLDVDSTVQEILGNNQKILRNKSSLRVIAGTASSQKGAFLKSYKVTIGGNEYNVASGAGLTTETGKIINVGKVNQAANQTAVLTVIDSRGNTASRSFTVQMLDYAAPQFLQASADRLNNYEEPTTMNIEARRAIVKPGSVDVNEVYLRYRIKQNPSGSYGGYVDLVKQNGHASGLWQTINVEQYMADYPNNKSYTVEVGIKDKLSDWSIILITLTEGIALLRYLQDKIMAGVPIVDQESDGQYIYFTESEEW